MNLLLENIWIGYFALTHTHQVISGHAKALEEIEAQRVSERAAHEQSIKEEQAKLSVMREKDEKSVKPLDLIIYY